MCPQLLSPKRAAQLGHLGETEQELSPRKLFAFNASPSPLLQSTTALGEKSCDQVLPTPFVPCRVSRARFPEQWRPETKLVCSTISSKPVKAPQRPSIFRRVFPNLSL